jgi:hypothetical protein
MPGVIPVFDSEASRRKAMLPPSGRASSGSQNENPSPPGTNGVPATLSEEFTLPPPTTGRGPAKFEADGPLPQRRREL